MSFNNPNHNDIIRANPRDPHGMLKYYGKSYNNLAKYAAARRLGRKTNLDDYQVIFDEFVKEWKYRYVDKPKLAKIHKKLATPVWNFGCSIGINVQDSSREFVRTINPTFEKVFDYNYASYIMRYGHFDSYKEYARENLNKFRYRKRKVYANPLEVNPERWAVNNVSDNF